jgi:hypothetical protein
LLLEELLSEIPGFVDMGSESIAPMVETSKNRLEILKSFFAFLGNQGILRVQLQRVCCNRQY